MTSTSSFTQLLSSGNDVRVQGCFTSIETIILLRTVRDGEPRTATSTFTQLRTELAEVLSCPAAFHGVKNDDDVSKHGA